MSFVGPLALLSKTNVNKACSDVEDNEYEEGLILNSDDKVVDYYYNNNVKRFYKKPRMGNFKNNSFKKSASTSNSVVENKKEGSSSEKNVEKKLVGECGYDYNYCNVETNWHGILC